MAASTTILAPPGLKQQCSAALLDKLAHVLPKGYKFTLHHLSTPPTRTDPLYSCPPGARPDRTYRESHFLAVSIDLPARTTPQRTLSSLPSSPATPSGSHNTSRQVLVLGLEVFIFTTAWSSTFFVSKADSTGYLHLLNLPKGSPSAIREISSAFVSYLVNERRRDNVQSIVSLFARAQNQYLFPGSVENKGKHVLDDRGLVRWWCRVLNSIMEEQGTEEDSIFRPANNKKGTWEAKKGYLVVPSLDTYESRAFLPRTASASSNWVLNHPLERISHFAREYDWVPPRCLVPKFPDDPKSRFRDELDLEASKSAQYEERGLWLSVRTMDQFWEMMTYRQECSGGHMTGFLWVVLEPHGWSKTNEVTSPIESLVTPNTSFDGSLASQPITPPRRRDGLPASTPKSSPLKLVVTPGSAQRSLGKLSPSKDDLDATPKKRILQGPIRPRLPRVKKHARNYVPNIPISTAYYYWPPEGRGTRIVAEADYKRSVDLLTKLDFENLELATRSSKRWIDEVGGGQRWALEVIGRRQLPSTTGILPTTVNNLTGLVRKKQLPTGVKGTGDVGKTDSGYPLESPGATAQPAITLLTPRKKSKNESGISDMKTGQPLTSDNDAGFNTSAPAVNVLVPRKKRKESIPGDDTTSGSAARMDNTSDPLDNEVPAVNLLGSGLVRKKPKTS